MVLALIVKIFESIGVEILHEKMRNTLFNVVYRPHYGKIQSFEKFLKIIFNKNKKSNKNYHIGRHFNFNLLDHDKNKKVHTFFNISKWYHTNHNKTY